MVETQTGYTLGISKERVDILNEIGYLNNEIVFYYYHNQLVAENSVERINVGYSEKPVAICAAAEENDFYNKSFEDKKKLICEKISDFKVSKPAEGFDDMVLGGSLTLHVPAGQHGYGMCWACCYGVWL